MDQQTAFLPHSTTSAGTRQRGGILKRIAVLIAVRKTRNDMARLTDTQLADIGLSRDTVQAEIQRPIWDVPSNWRSR